MTSMLNTSTSNTTEFSNENTSLNPLPLPTHKSYKALPSEFVGSQVKVLTDLNVSITEAGNESNNRRLVCRFYSLKAKMDKSWLLAGHSPRFILSNASFNVSQKLQASVRTKKSKTPHAYLTGTVESQLTREDSIKSHLLVEELLASGAQYLHYCPYRTDTFVVSDKPKFPATKHECESLKVAPEGMNAYCFETGILIY